MKNIIKYGMVGIILIIILLFGLNFILSTEIESNEDNFFDKITTITENKVNNIPENITGTVYEYGNSKITYVKSKTNVELFISHVKNNNNLKQINITNIPKDSTAFKTNDNEYVLLIVKPDKSEAVLIKSPNQKELIEAANKLNTGGEILNQITSGFDNIKLDTNQINLTNLQI